MKKIICLALAILMIAMTMVACNKNKNGDESSTPEDYIPSTPLASTPDSTPESTPEETPAETPAEVVLEECDETVYVVDAKSVYLRTAPSYDDASKATTVNYGTELRRIGKSDEWSKVVYENNEYYIASKFLSTEALPEVVFVDCDETVYVTADAYYRSIPSLADGAIVDSLAKGTAIKRTGVAYDTENDPEGLGWSRVEINGEIYFMRNSVLSTQDPAAESTPVESTPAETPVESTPVETPVESAPAESTEA